jgi:hypothetical protein
MLDHKTQFDADPQKFAFCAVGHHFLSPKLGLIVWKIGNQNSNGGHAMDAKYFREKAELCQRLADGLSLNNPGRFQLWDLADDFLERAKELEAQKEPLFALL